MFYNNKNNKNINNNNNKNNNNNINGFIGTFNSKKLNYHVLTYMYIKNTKLPCA